MLTTFSDALFDRLIAAVPATGSVDRARFSQSGIPVPVTHFLELTLDRRIELESDRMREVATKWVDHDLPELRLGREAYLRLVARHAHFPTDEWPRALKQAAHSVASHLVRPVPTLVHFVFAEDQTELPSEDVERRVSYFVAYSYLKTAVETYIERQGHAPVRRRQLSDMLSHVDRAMTSDWSPEEWVKALGPLERLSASAGYDGIPVSLLESYFEAKEAHALSARVRAWARRAGHANLGGEALISALQPVEEPPAPTPSPVSVPPSDTRTRRETTAASAPQGAETDSKKSDADESLPLWKQFAKTGPVTQPSVTDGASQTGEPLWKRFRSSLGEQIEPTALRMIEREILGDAARSRSEFVQYLFGGSEEAYGRVLGALRSTKSWPEASRLLADEVFRKYKVDIYSPAAVDFTNAVEARFRVGK